jgi:hypothetical protein
MSKIENDRIMMKESTYLACSAPFPSLSVKGRSRHTNDNDKEKEKGAS